MYVLLTSKWKRNEKFSWSHLLIRLKFQLKFFKNSPRIPMLSAFQTKSLTEKVNYHQRNTINALCFNFSFRNFDQWIRWHQKFSRIPTGIILEFRLDFCWNIQSKQQMASALFFRVLTLKSIYSEKATKFCKISTVDLTVTTLDKSKVEISQSFVAFSEYMNLNILKHKDFYYFIT